MGVEMIAEAWDADGDGWNDYEHGDKDGIGNGYMVTHFPDTWAEWHGKYRDNMRRFIKSDGNSINEYINGDQPGMGHGGTSNRKPYHSINFLVMFIF